MGPEAELARIRDRNVDPSARPIAFVGSRTWTDKAMVRDFMRVVEIIEGKITVVSGGAVGADELAAKCAMELGIGLREVLPLYSRYGKRAPMIRNAVIAKKSSVMLAFWDGSSTGTLDAIDQMKSLFRPVHIIKGTTDQLELL